MFFLILAIFYFLGSFEYDIEFKHIVYQANKTEAERVCRVRYNGSLPDITNYNDQMTLKIYMLNNGIHQSWIGLKKIDNSIPYWINSSEVCEYICS